MSHDLLEGLGEGWAEPFLVQERRHQLVEVEVAAAAAGDVVDEGALVVPGDDLAERLDRERDLDVGIAAEGHADDEVVADEAANSPHDLRGEAHPVLERAAPAIVAAVRPRRPELIDEGVVGGEQLDPIEARLLRAARGLREPLDDLLDLGLAHRVATVGVVVGRQPRRRPRRLVGVVEIAVLADVIDLMDHHRAMLVARVGEAAKVRNYCVVGMNEVAAGEDRGAVGGDRFDHDHRCAATGALGVVPEVALPWKPLLGHVRGVCAEVEAMLQGLVPKIERLEEVRKSFRH